MKKRTRLLAAVLTAALTVGTLAGCGGDTSSGGAKGKSSKDGEQVYYENTGSVIVGLNPIMNVSGPDNAAHGKICEPLVRTSAAKDNKYEIRPAAAESWDVSEDGKTYTFHLHKDMKWSDGEPFTAKDFEYTLQLMADPEVAAVNAWLFDGMIENFSESMYKKDGKTPKDIGVKAIDDNTLEIKIVHPATYFIELAAAIYPVREDKYKEWGDKYGSSADKIICSGPFEVESWNQNTEFVVRKNKNYWDADNVKLDKIVQKVIQETATAIQAFINGEIDEVSTSDPNWQEKIKSETDANVETVPDNGTQFLMFNLKNEFLQNTKIRQALSGSFDRQEFIDSIFNGEGKVMDTMMPDVMMIGDKSYTDRVNHKNYFVKELQEENKDMKKLLQEGLKELGKSDDTSQVKIRYASRGTTEISKKMAEWFKQNWEEKLGIQLDIDMMEWNIMWDKIDAGDYDIACGGWGPYYNEPSAFLTLFEPDEGYFNKDKTGWKDDTSKEFKKLLADAKNMTDEQQLAETYLKAEELLVKNAVVAPMYVNERPFFLNKRVSGVYAATVGQTDWRDVSVK